MKSIKNIQQSTPINDKTREDTDILQISADNYFTSKISGASFRNTTIQHDSIKPNKKAHFSSETHQPARNQADKLIDD